MVVTKHIGYAFVTVILLLSVGTFYFHAAESWSYVDSFYFSSMTLTTIGYGDFVPSTDETKIFTSVYSIFGIGVMLYLATSIVGVYILRQEKRFDRLISRIKKKRNDNKGKV